MGSEGLPDPSPEPEFYAPPSDALSQGDIVQGVPLAVLDYPLVVCRPGNKPGQAHYATPAECTRQAAFSRGPETIHATGKAPGLGFVIWEDCQIDKMKSQERDDERKWFVAVAPILPLTTIVQEEARAAIADGRKMAFFPLPALPAIELPASYVDLRLIWPVRQTMLSSRITTLTPFAKAAFYSHMFRFLTAREFALDATCPACGVQLSVASFLQDAREM